MKERPKGIANIHEVEGNKDIIVVIPTADYNGKYAKFINAGEDIELILKLFKDNYDFIDYRIGDKKDSTLGFNNLRKLKDISGQSYLNYLISNHPNEYFRGEFINSKLYLRLKGKKYE